MDCRPVICAGDARTSACRKLVHGGLYFPALCLWHAIQNRLMVSAVSRADVLAHPSRYSVLEFPLLMAFDRETARLEEEFDSRFGRQTFKAFRE